MMDINIGVISSHLTSFQPVEDVGDTKWDSDVVLLNLSHELRSVYLRQQCG